MIAVSTYSPSETRGPEIRPLSLQIEDPVARADWDESLATLPDATFFHTSAWARTLADSYGFSCRYITAIRNGRLEGLLPLMEVRSCLRGTRGVGLPFTDECPALTVDGEAQGQLGASVLNFAHIRRWRYVEGRGRPELFHGARSSISFSAHRLDLLPGEKALFENLDRRRHRCAIQKAERSGVTVNISKSIDAIRAYYELHCRTRHKHGLPPQPFSFFEAVQANILEKDSGFVALAVHGGRILAGAVFFHFEGKAIYKYSASDERVQELRGPNLVLWAAIKHLATNGFNELNFGKTSLSNEGLRRFKRGWGATEYSLHYWKYDCRAKHFATDVDLANGWHNQLFRLLPMSWSRAMGGLLYRHMT